MTKIYENNIEGSPITSVEISEEKGVTLYGRPRYTYLNNCFLQNKCNLRQNLLYISSASKFNLPNRDAINFTQSASLKRFFDFIIQKYQIPQVVTPEINHAIENFHSSYIKRLEDKASEVYLRIQPAIKQKLQEAQAEGKKLLVILGERHYYNDPPCGQLLALDICQQSGITNLLIEQSSIKNYKNPSSQFLITLYTGNLLLLNIVTNSELQKKISLHPIDPLNGKPVYQKILTRNKAINDAILNVDKNAMLVIGASHIPHIIKDSKLSEKYKFAIFYNTLPRWEDYYDKKSKKDLETLLEEQELFNSELREAVSKTLSMNTVSYSQVPFLYDNQLDNGSRTFHLMKRISPEEIKDISITPDQVDSIGSEYDVLDIAINVISKHNKQSKLLDVLSNKKAWYKKIDDITSVRPYAEKHYTKLYNSLAFNITSPESISFSSKTWEENILSVYGKFDQQLIADPEVDLIGNWDVHPDC